MFHNICIQKINCCEQARKKHQARAEVSFKVHRNTPISTKPIAPAQTCLQANMQTCKRETLQTRPLKNELIHGRKPAHEDEHNTNNRGTCTNLSPGPTQPGHLCEPFALTGT